MTSPINIETLHSTVLGVVDKIMENEFVQEQSVLFTPLVVASLSRVFYNHLSKDDGVDFETKCLCLHKALSATLDYYTTEQQIDDNIEEDDDPDFFETADEDDVFLRNVCIGILKTSTLLEESLGVRPASQDWINYGPLKPKIKRRPGM